MKSCPYCGSTLNDVAKFCVECGKLQPEAAPAAPQQAPVAPQEPQEAPATPVDAPAASATPDFEIPDFEIPDFGTPEPAPAAPVTDASAFEVPVFDEPAAPADPDDPAKPVDLPTFDETQTASQAPAAEDDMPVITTVPSRKQMLSTFQFIALSLLYGLPVIGLVFLFVFGAGHPKNVSLKRFSSAMLILRLTFWIVLLALLMVAMIKNGKLLSDAFGQLIPAVEKLLKALFA